MKSERLQTRRALRAEDEAVTDARLVELVRADSARALAKLYRRHSTMVHHVAYRFLASEEDAQDVLQDVFAGLPEALRSYEERGRFPYWLKRIAVRTSLMTLRTKNRRCEDSLGEHRVPSSTSMSPNRITDYLALHRAIAQLSETQRMVLVSKLVEGYSHAEIAARLGISEGASATRLHRALRALWRALGEPERDETR